MVLFISLAAIGQPIQKNYFSTNSTPIPNWTSITSFGAKGDGITDDTAALQSAINSLTNTGGTVFIPPITNGSAGYLINGPFTQPPGKTLTNFCQIYLPSRDLQTQPIISITLQGGFPPSLNTIWTTNNQPAVSTNGSIIISTNIPANGLYSIIGGGAPVGSIYNQTAVRLNLRNLIFQTYDAPKTTPLNMEWVSQFDFEHGVVDTHQPGGAQSDPTNFSVGIIMPGINNWVVSRLRDVDVRGYQVGIKVNEHSDFDDVRVWLTEFPFWFPGGTHACYMGHTIVTGHKYWNIGGPAGFVQRVFWATYATEHSVLKTNSVVGSSTWANSTNDFGDTNSTLRGIINFSIVDGGVGAADDIGVNTGTTTNVTFFNLNNHKFTRVDVQPVDPSQVTLFSVSHTNGNNAFKVSETVANLSVPLNHGFADVSNFLSGVFYTNNYAGVETLETSYSLSQSTAGQSSLQLWRIPLITNSITLNNIGTNFGVLTFKLYPGLVFCLTNQSTGGGSSSIFKTTVWGD